MITFTITVSGGVSLNPSNGGTVNFTIEPIAHSIPAGGTDGQVLTKTSSTDYEVAWETPSGGGGGSGTVTSVAMTVPTGLTVAGSPITSAGTLALTYTSGYVGYTTAEQTKVSNLSGTNTGDQTSIVGITGTKAQFDTAVTDGNFMYTGDAPTAHTHPQSEVTNLTTDLAAKAPIASPTFTGTVTTPAIIVSSETASKVAIIDASKNVKSADTTTYPDLTELSYVKGVTSAIQTQLNGKQASGSYLTASNIVETITNGVTTNAPSENAVFDALAAKASSTFVDAISGLIETVSDKTYKFVVKIPFACTINETVTICTSGTATATFKINSTALGGTANSVSSSEQTQSHASANSVAAGDDIQVTISSNSSCLDMSFTIKITRTI